MSNLTANVKMVVKLFDNLVNLFLELFVGAAAAFGQLARFAERQTGIRKGKAVDGLGGIFGEQIAAVFQDNIDADFVQNHQVPIKIPDPDLEAARQAGTGLRALAQKRQQPIKPSRPIGGNRLGKSRKFFALLGHVIDCTEEGHPSQPPQIAHPQVWEIVDRERLKIKMPGDLDYLVIAPHPDDAELGAGGAILLLKAQGASVGVLDLTDGEPTPHGSPEIRRRETDAASAVLGLDWRGNLGLVNRRLEADLESRARLAGMIRQLRPRFLLAPYWEDAHPDHVAASALVDAARFWGKLTKTDLPGTPYYPQRILSYFSIHLRIHPRPSFILDVSNHIDRKMQAIACYRSQFIEGRPA